MSTQSAIRPALAAISVIVSRPTSGRPISAADVPNPVMYRAGNESDLHAGATVPAAEGRLAPDGAGQVHLSIAFPAGSVEARGNSASAFSMSYRPGLRTRCPAPGGRPGGRSWRLPGRTG